MGEVEIILGKHQKGLFLHFDFGILEFDLDLFSIKNRDKEYTREKGEASFDDRKIYSEIKKFYENNQLLFSMYMDDQEYFTADLEKSIFHDADQDEKLLNINPSFTVENSIEKKFRLRVIKYRLSELFKEFLEKEELSERYSRAYNYILMNNYYMINDFYNEFANKKEILFRDNYLPKSRVSDDISNDPNENFRKIVLKSLDKWIDACIDKGNSFFVNESSIDREWEVLRALYQYREQDRKVIITKCLREETQKILTQSLKEKYALWFLERYDLKNASFLIDSTSKEIINNLKNFFRKKIFEKIFKSHGTRSEGKHEISKKAYRDICVKDIKLLKKISKQKHLRFTWFTIIVFLALLCDHTLSYYVFNNGSANIIPYRAILIILYPFLIFNLLIKVKSPTKSLSTLMPRMICGIILGYFLLLHFGALFSYSFTQGTCAVTIFDISLGFIIFVCVYCIIPLIASAWYLTVEIYKLQKNRHIESIGLVDTKERVNRVFSQGLIYSFFIGLIFCDLFGSYKIEYFLKSIDISLPSSPGLFGNIYPIIVLLNAPISLFVGIFAQLLWEDKPITHPVS